MVDVVLVVVVLMVFDAGRMVVEYVLLCVEWFVKRLPIIGKAKEEREEEAEKKNC